MEDQLDALKRLDVKAAKLNATSGKEEVNFVQMVGFSLEYIYKYTNLELF